LQNFILDIDGIQAHGIGAADITKLKANGFYTIASLTFSTLTSLKPLIFKRVLRVAP
jgi:meiotic recombination protein DMC1